MPLTRLQIVDLALDNAQLDSGFRSKARLWLNVIMEQQSRDFRWPFYNKVGDYTPFVAGQVEYDVPSDYFRSDSIYRYSSGGARGTLIPIVEPYIFDQVNLSNNPSTYLVQGPSQVAMIDISRNKIVFDQMSAAPTDGFKLRYFRAPEVLSLNDSDDGVVPDFEDQNFLIQEVTNWAMKFNDDERQPAQAMESKMAMQQSKRTVYDNDGKSSIPLNQINFRVRRRR